MLNRKTLYKTSLIFTAIISLVGVLFKLQHYPYGNFLLGMSTFTSLGFIIPGLLDVFPNRRFKTHEKLMWTIGFVFLSWVAGILYWSNMRNNKSVHRSY